MSALSLIIEKRKLKIMQNTFLSNLHTFFSIESRHHLSHKIVFAPGTAPMRKENSEIEEILLVTDFEKAYFVDPVYGVEGKDSPFGWDVEKIYSIATNVILEGVSPIGSHERDSIAPVGRSRMTKITFTFQGTQREVIFVAGDATIAEHIPKDFTIFFSGKRIGLYPGVGLRGTPSEYLLEIVRYLPEGGYLVPDRSLLDDAVYFLIPPHELGLEEVPGIRVPIPHSEFPKGYSEDKRFIRSENAPGVGLYRLLSRP
jgi:hypothetical protein